MNWTRYTDAVGRMQDVIGATPSTPSLDEVRAGKATIYRGMKGAAIEYIQKGVGANVDGDFGPNTEKAVTKFQTGKALRDAYGVVGRNTLAAIDKVMLGSTPSTPSSFGPWQGGYVAPVTPTPTGPGPWQNGYVAPVAPVGPAPGPWQGGYDMPYMPPMQPQPSPTPTPSIAPAPTPTPTPNFTPPTSPSLTPFQPQPPSTPWPERFEAVKEKVAETPPWQMALGIAGVGIVAVGLFSMLRRS